MTERFYQPQNSKDAMRQIEKLFNKYCQAPLTAELLAYHQKLLQQMKTQVLPVAKQEGIQQRVQSAESMIAIMQRWAQVKLSGKPFTGKMKNFELINPAAQTNFKRRNIKVKNQNNLRSSRH